MTGTLWIDVSSSMNNVVWRVLGIQRVELELALRISEETRVEFVRHDTAKQRFITVSTDEVRSRHRQLMTESIASAIVPPSSAAQSAVGRLGSWVAAHVPDRILPGWLLKLGWRAEERATKVLQLLRRLESNASLTLRSIGKDGVRQERFPGGVSGDHFLCLTFHYDPAVFLELFEWIRSRQLESTFVIYDMIPSLLPQYSTLDPAVFDANVRSVVEEASRLLTISECSASDIRSFCEREEIECQPISVLHLASAVTLTEPRRPSSRQPLENFVLCVGTIEPRKNHQLLLDVWEEFAHANVADAPILVVAGSSGWLNELTMRRLLATPGLSGKVVFIDSPTDPELHWLYRNCLFTVFPSHYEGWGLPVVESLDAGKICLASDRGSLMEAGMGVCVHLDPNDRRAWSNEILDLSRDTERRERLESELRRSHTFRSIDDVAADLRVIIG